MFKYNLGDKVLYNKEYEIIRRGYLDILDEEPRIRYMIKNGDKRIFNVEERELSTTPRFTIKVIDNEDNNECVYFTDKYTLRNKNGHFDTMSRQVVGLQFESIL
ncbi:hypothetical protein [Terrisporobacter sp.]|uniref:hypothetical protein n=1 Tax=Terrisporobacter sp. TaxID=1965305 RepID=UPI00260B008D|nr:hypothetical protein [Terrisporobacter sp.]